MIEIKNTTADPEARAPSDVDVADKDAAWTVVSDVAREIDPQVEKKVLRKIDLFFMPAMMTGMS